MFVFQRHYHPINVSRDVRKVIQNNNFSCFIVEVKHGFSLSWNISVEVAEDSTVNILS